MSALSIVFTIAIIVLIIMLAKYFLSDKNSLSNIQNGQNSSTITASSLATNSSGTSDSNFAYSVWFYVNDWNYRYGEPKVVFGRMGALSDASGGSINGVSGLDPCPSVVLGAIENNIIVSLGCYPGVNEQPTTTGGKTVIHNCMISNIPIQKWVNLTLSVYGRTMDLYVDGKLVRTCLLPGIANINNNADIYVTPKGGFNGWTSNLQYYPNSLNPQDAWNIYTKGYGGSMLSNLFGSYEVEISLIQNGTTQSSVTI
uniref:Lectin/glucanase superfamily protein n=1 Tax=viral metagenome TaxID=1070528 RepID=A0A6C0IFA9_9ZZZZ